MSGQRRRGLSILGLAIWSRHQEGLRMEGMGREGERGAIDHGMTDDNAQLTPDEHISSLLGCTFES